MDRPVIFLLAVAALILTSVGVGALQWQDTLQGLLHDSGGLPENTLVGSTVGSLQVTDATGPVTYSVDPNPYLSVNATSGAVVLQQRLVYDLVPQFNVTFRASASSSTINASYSVLVAAVFTSGPVFQSTPYSVQLAESASVGSIVFPSITVTDTDPNAQISLLCVSVPGDSQSTCSTFTIVGQSTTLISGSGYLLTVTASIQLNALLNFARFPSYNLTLQAVDTGAVQKVATVTVSVSVLQPSGPYFVNAPITLTMAENSPLGTSIGTIQARKKISSNTLTLTILQDAKKYFLLNNFRVDSSTNMLSAQVSVNAANISSVANAASSSAVSGIYYFIVQVTESSPTSPSMTTTTNVSVVITDANNYAPAFNQPSYTVYVLENVPFGTIINNTNITVTNADLGNNSYFQLSTTNAGAFTLLPASAYGFAIVNLFVSTNVPDFYDYENLFYRVQQYQMQAVETRTPQGYVGYASLTVQLVNVDEYYPVFGAQSYSRSVTDNRPTGFVVLTVTAIDLDDGLFGDVTYSINSAQTTLFRVDPQTGDISVAAVLTGYDNQVIIFNCTATDGGGLATSVPVSITVTPFIPEGLQFSQASYTGSINETATTFNAGVTVMASVVGSSASGDTVTYKITSGNTNDRAFVIDAVTGKISVTRLVAYSETQKTGQIVLTVLAEVLGSSPLLSGTVTVTIKIINSNSHVPVFSQTQYTASIDELSIPGTVVTRIQSTSLNVDRFTQNGYRLVGGSLGKFLIDSSSGIISVAPGASLLIASNQPQYILTIQAYVVANPVLVALASVVININPANLNFPVFTQSAYVAFIPDLSPIGTTVLTVRANDIDKTANIVYSIVANGTTTGRDSNGNPLSANITASLQTAFLINPQTGVITNNIVINASRIAAVTFTVRAIDTNGQGPTPQVTTVPVTVSITTPTSAVQFLAPWTPTNPQFVLNVRELQPVGLSIALLFALDTVASVACSRYSKVNGTDPSNYFSVVPSTGSVVLNTLIRYDNLTNPQLTFDIQAFANSGASALAHVIVNVLKVSVDVPVFPQNSYTFQLSSSPTPGLVIGSVQARDVNAPPYLPLIYSLSGNGSNLFAIDNSGMLSVASGASFAATLYKILVTATNSAPDPSTSLSATVGVQITVSVSTNTAPRFIPSSFYQFIVNAGVTTGTFVGQVVASATYGAVSYSITSGNTHNLFIIGNDTGYIVTAGGLANYVSDIPTVLVVTAANNGQPPQTSDCNVAIFIVNYQGSRNSVFFTFPAYDGQVVLFPEEQPIGTWVTQLTGKSSSQGQQLVYVFEQDSYVAYDESFFSLDYTTGIITSQRRLDREVQDTYLLIVVVTDGVFNMARRLIIQLTDVNDNPPVFDKCDQYIYYDPVLANVAEGQTPPVPVWTVQACDPDGIVNNTIYYYFVDCSSQQPTSVSQFSLNKTTGTIFTVVSLDYETQNSYNLCVLASNSANLSASQVNPSTDSIQDVTVNVLNINNRGPTYASVLGPSKIAIAGVLATVPYDTQIIRLPADDTDQYLSNIPLQYSIGSQQQFGNGTAAEPRPFLIDADTGAVTSALTSFIPYLGQYFVSTVTATDSQSRTDSATLKTYVVRETDQLKFTINMAPKQLQSRYPQLLQDVSRVLGNGQLYSMSLKYSTDSSGKITYLQSDLCFFILSGNNVLNSDAALQKLRESAVQSIYDQYAVTSTGMCTTRVTTKYWSGNYWLWWLLIALALLILLLTIILIVIVAIMWCRHGCHSVNQPKTKPVVLLVDQASQLDVPDAAYPADFEWQEQLVHVM